MTVSFFKKSCILFIIALLTACQNEKGEDKHPEIPQFPKTTNSEIKIKILQERFSDLFYSNRSLFTATSDSITFYDLNSQKKKLVKGYFDCYQKNAIVYHNSDDNYFSINADDLSEKKFEAFEENEKYNAILDSIKTKLPANTDIETKIADSIYIKYFYNKYKIDIKFLPYTVYLGDKYYIETKTKEFILKNPQLCLKELFNNEEKPVIKLKTKKSTFRRYNSASAEDSKIFKSYDYSMIDKSWGSSGGGNHYIPAIPSYSESGFYYYEFKLGTKQGKFKLHTPKSGKISDISSVKNSIIFVANNQLFEVLY